MGESRAVRDRRLADALRSNLQRRKAQARARSSAAGQVASTEPSDRPITGDTGGDGEAKGVSLEGGQANPE
ncbi:MAG: hypothetical protein GC150_16200 [Rhizobiales bacterium]|nr:hypothetical protein [Hyphomicrobiales bacterium]